MTNLGGKTLAATLTLAAGLACCMQAATAQGTENRNADSQNTGSQNTDIGNTAPYADVRGWSVSALGTADNVTSCRAVHGSGEAQIILRYDGGLSLMVPAVQSGATVDATLWIDGLPNPGQASLSGGYATLDLNALEQSGLEKGRRMSLQLGEASKRDYDLRGTTAAILKAQECFAEKTGAPAPAAPARITGQNVGLAYFDGGRFRQRVDGSWIEEDVGGATRVFDETGRDAQSVTLDDSQYGTQIRIDTKTMQILQATGDGPFQEIHAITGLDTYVSPRAG